MTELQEQAIDTVRKYWDKGNSIYNLSLPYPRISFRLKGGTAGTASYIKNEIRLNAGLLEENGQTFLDRTPAHEVAHIFAFKQYGIQRTRRGSRQVHGWAWKSVMREFGLNSERCHSYETSTTVKRASKPYVYTCGCQEFNLTAIRHRRILQGKTYNCKTCKSRLTFVEIAA